MEVMSNYARASDAKNYVLFKSIFFENAKIELAFDQNFLVGRMSRLMGWIALLSS